MKLVRKGCFETNSSSSHTVVLSLEGCKYKKSVRHRLKNLKGDPTDEELKSLAENIKNFKDEEDKVSFMEENPGHYIFKNFIYKKDYVGEAYDFGWGPGKVSGDDELLSYLFLWLAGGRYDSKSKYENSLVTLNSFIQNPLKFKGNS